MLDEHHDRAVAVELRKRGHDVVAVTEHVELRQLVDAELLAAAVDERRAVVTENVGHFAVLHLQYLSVAKTHFGIVFTHRRRFPRKQHSAAMMRALEEWLRTRPGDDALRDQTYWL